MLIADFDSNNVVGFTQPKVGLLETHRSKISLHRAKAGYDYPTIRLPHTLSKLAGLPTHIYQTVHQGALAFLVVVSSSNKREEESPMKSENPSMSLRSPYLHSEGRAFESPRAHLFFLIRRLTRSALKLIFLATVLRISSSSRCGCESTTPIVSGARR
jgi:hypothetical protein